MSQAGKGRREARVVVCREGGREGGREGVREGGRDGESISESWSLWVCALTGKEGGREGGKEGGTSPPQPQHAYTHQGVREGREGGRQGRTSSDLVLGIIRAAVRVVIILARAADERAVENVGLGTLATVAVGAAAAGGATMVRGLGGEGGVSLL